jgi:hypothetical protein
MTTRATPAERLEAMLLLTLRRVRDRPAVKARLAGMAPEQQAAHLAELTMEAVRADPTGLELLAAKAAEGTE